jgi:hypothetical protein
MAVQKVSSKDEEKRKKLICDRSIAADRESYSRGEKETL